MFVAFDWHIQIVYQPIIYIKAGVTNMVPAGTKFSLQKCVSN